MLSQVGKTMAVAYLLAFANAQDDVRAADLGAEEMALTPESHDEKVIGGDPKTWTPKSPADDDEKVEDDVEESKCPSSCYDAGVFGCFCSCDEVPAWIRKKIPCGVICTVNPNCPPASASDATVVDDEVVDPAANAEDATEVKVNGIKCLAFFCWELKKNSFVASLMKMFSDEDEAVLKGNDGLRVGATDATDKDATVLKANFIPKMHCDWTHGLANWRCWFD